MPDERPNILIFVPHDLGQHLGCYGVETVHNPNIDRLAAGGVRFQNSFCTAPQCSPSRASIFTGRYPHSNGVMGLTHGEFGWDLDSGERHMAEVLRDAGWHTALVEYGHEAKPGREHERFDEVLAAEQYEARRGHCDAPVRVAAVAEFLRHRQGCEQPFFLEIPPVEVHRQQFGYNNPPDTSKGVYVPPYIKDEISSREDFTWFQGSVRKLDEAVGNVMAALDENGHAERTIVVFTTDHGIPFPRAKCAVYDPGLEVALILYREGAAWSDGRVVEHLVSNIDYEPTLLEMAGVPVPDNVQGRSFAPLLAGGDYEPRTGIFGELTYHSYYDPRRCIRTPTHKLIVNFAEGPSYMEPSQQARPKCVTVTPPNPAFAHHPLLELYDLREDPWEQVNLAGKPEHAAVQRELLDRIYLWMTGTGDPLLAGPPTPPMHQRAVKALIGE